MVRIMSRADAPSVTKVNYSLVWVFYNWPYYSIFIQFVVLCSFKTSLCSFIRMIVIKLNLTSSISKMNTTDCKRTRLMHHIIYVTS